jgi:ABC-2 type transport system permease protein/sodium transport system permease protein
MTDLLSHEQHEPEPFRMTWAQQWQLTLKELRETLRDRRTILTLLIMPILLYPLMGLVFRMMSLNQQTYQRSVYRIAVQNEREVSFLGDLIGPDKIISRGEHPLTTTDEAQWEIFMPQNNATFDLKQLVEHGVADLGVVLHFKDQQQLGQMEIDLDLIVSQDSELSEGASRSLTRIVNNYNNKLLKNWATIQDPNFHFPFQVKEVVLDAKKKKTSSLIILLPLALLLMTVTGGVYPAIDLTAGERERETMETLIALPIPRFWLLLAKYVAVVTVIILTGLVNLVAMSITIYALQLETTIFGDFGLTWSLILQLLALEIIFALFFGSILLLVTGFARSFKEAQAYLVPLLLGSIFPGMVILMPGWKLEGVVSVIPLVNLLLLSREIMEGTVQLLPLFATLISTLMYAVVALNIAGQVFGADAFALGSSGQMKDLFHRPEHRSNTPALTLVIGVLTALFPMYFISSSMLSRYGSTDIQSRIILSGLLTILLFVIFPMLMLIYQRVSIRTAFNLRWPKLLLWPAVILLGLSTWPLIYECVIAFRSMGLHDLTEKQMTQVKDLLAAWKQIPLAVIVLTFGIIPGVCEELFFRGLLMGGIKSATKSWGAIIISAIVFGLFHVVLAGGAAPERLIPSTLMGVLLGWVAMRSQSIFPSMLLHAIHNSSLLILAHSQEQVASILAPTTDTEHLPFLWIGCSAAGVMIGLVWVYFASRLTRTETKTLTQQ